MSNLIKCLLFIFLFLGWASSYAQQAANTDVQIALQYYRNAEYDKAAEVYGPLYYSNRSSVYFRYYTDCLIKLEEYAKAEKVCKEQIKLFKSELNYWVDLGYIYQLQEQEAKAKSTYLAAIKKMDADQYQAIRLASAFMAKRLYDYAEETYLLAKKQMNGSYGFQMELAQLYYYQRSYPKMIDQYLDLLAISDQYIQTVQNRLQNAVYNDVDESLKIMLGDALLKRLREQPEATVYSELLIWLYVQDKNFYGALIQAKALDKRLLENGRRLVALARIATDNNDFKTAIEAYEYVINKGKYLEYYFAARNEMLDVMFKRIDLGLDAKYDDFVRLEQNYITALSEMGSNAENVDMIKNLAHIQAFYLNKTTEAWFLLEDAVQMRGVDKMTKGELELELADIYLAAGKIWDATFAYARVEEDNKNNPIGAEAKFRKARLAYYIGNFEWSMAQLDVLKGSTSKLTANDAAYLSLFIYDNTGWDSVETALETYARADLYYYQSKDSLTLLTLDSIITFFPDHALIDEVYNLKASVYKKNGRYEQARACYLKIVTDYPYEVLGDKALFALAQLVEEEYGDKITAQEYYKQLLVDYPGSVFTVEARHRFRILRGDEVVN